MSEISLSSQFDPAEFLQKYWGKQPVLLKNLVQYPDPLSAEELAFVACQPEIDCRLVLGNSDWKLKYGPFQESDFTQLPAENWTLLVQAIDLLVSEFKELRDLFDFLPNWRFDDVMASYAVPGGGVGPHFDFYDVFLVQGTGQRRWLLGDKQSESASIETDSGLQLLKNFAAIEEYVLNPGDVLYIPPKYAHWGESISASFCYSVGFRAPSAADMLEGFSDALIARSAPSNRYTDSVIAVPQDRYEIAAADLEGAYRLLQEQVKHREGFYKWFGAHMTQPKYSDLFSAIEHPPSLHEVRESIALGATEYRLNPISRVAYFPLPNNQGGAFCIDARVYTLSQLSYEIVVELCTSSSSFNNLFNENSNEELANLALDLIAEGSLVCSVEA